MALIHRISRLFKADLHAVLDQIEEPEHVLKQAIRDMQDDLEANERRVRLHEQQQEALAQRANELQGALGETDEQLNLCFEAGNDELARKLVRKKLEGRRVLQRLDRQHAAGEKSLAGQRATLNENRATLEGLRQKAELFAQRAPAPANGGKEFDDIAWMARDMTVGDDEVEAAFLQEKSLRRAP
jgi:phage shock protein A